MIRPLEKIMRAEDMRVGMLVRCKLNPRNGKSSLYSDQTSDNPDYYRYGWIEDILCLEDGTPWNALFHDEETGIQSYCGPGWLEEVSPSNWLKQQRRFE